MISEFISKYFLEGPWCIYWLFVLVGFIFRIETLRYTFLSEEMKIKKILLSILLVFVLTVILTTIKQTTESSSALVIIGMILLIFNFYSTLSQKCDNNTTDSLLVIINSVFVTALSYINFPASLCIAAFVIWIAYLIKKHCAFEEKSEFCEIIWLSLEAVVISFLSWYYNWESLKSIFFLVLFTQTALTTINVFVMYIIRCINKEDPDQYLHRIFDIHHL